MPSNFAKLAWNYNLLISVGGQLSNRITICNCSHFSHLEELHWLALHCTGLSLVWLRNWTKPPLCLALCYNYLSIIKSGNGKIFFDIGYRKHQMRSKTRTESSKVWFGPKNDGANETQSLLSSGSEVLLAFIFYILGSSTIILHRNI